MPDTVHLPILCRAPVTFVPPRGSQPKVAVAAFTVDVLAPSLSPSEAPVVMAHRRFKQLIQCRRFDGRTWMTDGDRYPPARVRELLGDATNYRFELVGRADAIPEGAVKGAVPAGAKILDDGRPAAEARLREVARRLAFVDGNLWIAGPVPALFVFAHQDGRPRVEARQPRRGGEYSFGFGLDRQAEMHAFIAANQFAGGYKSVPDPLEIDFDASVDWSYPEPRANAFVAVRQALGALSSGLVDHPPGILAYLGRLAALRDALKATDCPAHVPAEADALLAEIEATRAALKGMHPLGHAIRLGRDAIARSRALVDADVEALSALA